MHGFVIISHDNPPQLEALCAVLTKLYDNPPIVCHHDFSQSKIDRSRFAATVTFVEHPRKTGWGAWNVTAGVLRAIEFMYQDRGPDWFTLLSAVDYPVKPAAYVYRKLEAANVDAFMDLRPMNRPPPTRHVGQKDAGLDHHSNVPLATRRYLHARLQMPKGNFDGQPRTIRLPFASPFNPFNEEYHCYVGSQWFTANRRCAQRLINLSKQDETLRAYMQRRWHADECFVNTVLGNARELRIEVNPYRYTQWRQMAASPEWLDLEDLAKISSSEAFFARKISIGSPLIKGLDQLLVD